MCPCASEFMPTPCRWVGSARSQADDSRGPRTHVQPGRGAAPDQPNADGVGGAHYCGDGLVVRGDGPAGQGDHRQRNAGHAGRRFDVAGQRGHSRAPGPPHGPPRTAPRPDRGMGDRGRGSSDRGGGRRHEPVPAGGGGHHRGRRGPGHQLRHPLRGRRPGPRGPPGPSDWDAGVGLDVRRGGRPHHRSGTGRGRRRDVGNAGAGRPLPAQRGHVPRGPDRHAPPAAPRPARSAGDRWAEAPARPRP